MCSPASDSLKHLFEKLVQREVLFMAFVSTNINIGHLQGILVGDIYSPRSNLALLTIKVKAEKREPQETAFYPVCRL